jgi:hypothetical protein
MKIENILSGWENFISKNEVTEELARERATHCAGCPNLKRGMLLAFIKDDLKEIEGHYCKICKCPLSAKLRSINEECPIQKW